MRDATAQVSVGAFLFQSQLGISIITWFRQLKPFRL
jgi:hypothetical protein